MPRPGMRWRHVIVNTHSTWLHGDERGFRSRDHRIHSSGDYKHRPPIEEHAGLREYMQRRSAAPTVLAPHLLKAVGEAILGSIVKQEFRVVAISANATHVHVVVELPDDVERIHEVVGWFKRFGTRAIRQIDESMRDVEMWAEGETYKPIDSLSHREAATDYVLHKQGDDAWTWSPTLGGKW